MVWLPGFPIPEIATNPQPKFRGRLPRPTGGDDALAFWHTRQLRHSNDFHMAKCSALF
jgi:hypothetical protein